jgi:hypothetical protein
MTETLARLEPAASRLDRFIGLSALLTGFAPLHLLGTGMAEAYLRATDAALPAGVLDELLDAFGHPPAAAALVGGPAQPGGPASAWPALSGGTDPEAAGQAILGDAKLGAVARTLILLWYRGTWTALPQEWRSVYGASPQDTDHVVSAEAYQAGLQWDAAGAHPAGARQQGYGAWASPPDALETESAPGTAAVRLPRQAGAPSVTEGTRS